MRVGRYRDALDARPGGYIKDVDGAGIVTRYIDEALVGADREGHGFLVDRHGVGHSRCPGVQHRYQVGGFLGVENADVGSRSVGGERDVLRWALRYAYLPA